MRYVLAGHEVCVHEEHPCPAPQPHPPPVPAPEESRYAPQGRSRQSQSPTMSRKLPRGLWVPEPEEVCAEAAGPRETSIETGRAGPNHSHPRPHVRGSSTGQEHRSGELPRNRGNHQDGTAPPTAQSRSQERPQTSCKKLNVACSGPNPTLADSTHGAICHHGRLALSMDAGSEGQADEVGVLRVACIQTTKVGMPWRGQLASVGTIGTAARSASMLPRG